MAIVIPEIILFNAIKNVLTLIRKDYNDNIADTTKSFLYRILVGNKIQRYNLFEQAVTVLITNETDPRHLDVNLFFNAKRASVPTLHITLPSENEKNNSMNNGEGFREYIYEDSINTAIKTFNRRFSPKYSIIITSDNTNEIVLLYHLLRSIFISLNGHFNMVGLENPKLSGGDININPDLVPLGVFLRALNMEFEYDVEGQDLFPTEMWPFDIIEAVGTVIIS